MTNMKPINETRYGIEYKTIVHKLLLATNSYIKIQNIMPQYCPNFLYFIDLFIRLVTRTSLNDLLKQQSIHIKAANDKHHN